MRCAFTIVELLVVLAIIGLVAAVMIPAVQQGREASRRAQCASHLQELGRALHNYESAFRAFPPAMPAMPNNPIIGNAWYAPHVRLLPYVEQGAAFGNVNLSQPVLPAISKYSGPVPANVSPNDPRLAVVPVFKCPSDAALAALNPAANYRVSAGSRPYDWHRGPFVILQPRTSGQFRDGLSATVGMSEKLVGAANPATFSRRRDFWYSGSAALQSNPSADEMITICASLVAPPSDFYSFSGSSWFYAGYEFTWYNHVVPPNAQTPDCAVDLADLPDGVSAGPVSGGLFQATSYHSAGVNCLMMDGACRFISDDVDISVWRAFATVASGEALAGAPGDI